MKPLNILVVDDEPFICEIIADMLHYSGHRATVTTDSREGLVLFKKNDWDVVFTDYRMPELDGVELARRMKALKSTIPVCLVTGTQMDLQPEELALFAAVIAKPFVSDNLTEAIARVLISPSALMHDTTRAPRYSVNWPIDYLPLESKALAGPSLKPRRTVIRNLAEGGIAFVPLEALPISSLCAFVAYPPKSQKPFLAIGQIRWQREIDGQNIAGTKWILWELENERDLAVGYAQQENLTQTDE